MKKPSQGFRVGIVGASSLLGKDATSPWPASLPLKTKRASRRSPW